jgi:uncharacterized protein (DUF427 family)
MNNSPVHPPSATTESVWDYPRPPRLEPTARRIRIQLGASSIADTAHSTQRALRILETSHPPVYYLPREAVAMHLLRRSVSRASFCEFKGVATYWNLDIPQSGAPPILAGDVAWSYESPSKPYAALAGYLAFYASRLAAVGAECWVDDERVEPQAGDFYGGWITSDLRGPFKGAPGTLGW